MIALITVDNQAVINQQEWERAENRTGWLGTYRSAKDRRIWVPKRTATLGWTLDFAHRGAWWSLLGLLTVPFGLAVLLLLGRLFR